MTSALFRQQLLFAKLLPSLLLRAGQLYDAYVPGECARSDEQASINSLGAAGRYELAQYLRAAHAEAWTHLAIAIENNAGNGIQRSLHQLGLAIDLKLFKGTGERDSITGEYVNYVYLVRSEDYQALGEYWESLNIWCRWGGRFTPRADGSHFSVEFMGVK